MKLNKLIRLIQLIDIDVVVLPKLSAIETRCLCWDINNQVIKLGTYDDDDKFVIAVLAHELGHCLSVRKGSLTTRLTYSLYLFSILHSAKKLNEILKEETRAWDLGFKFLKKNNFLIDEEMIDIKNQLLNSHVKKIKKLSMEIK